MKQENIKPRDVYMTYDNANRLMHASIREEGTSGFLRYIREDMTTVQRHGLNPHMWVTHYRFPDGRAVPPMKKESMPDYMRLVADAARKHGGSCLHTANIADLFYCLRKGIVPLTPASQRTALAQENDYNPIAEYGSNMPHSDALIPEYRAYTAIETREGVVVFTNTPEGERQRQAFEKYHEVNFFNPAQPGGQMNYFEIIAEPSAMQGHTDKLTGGLKEGFAEAFTDPSVTRQGRCLRTFNMDPSAENYELFCRRDENGPTRKKLSEMTFGDIWRHMTGRVPDTGPRRAECVETTLFDDRQREMTYKVKIKA